MSIEFSANGLQKAICSLTKKEVRYLSSWYSLHIQKIIIWLFLLFIVACFNNIINEWFESNVLQYLGQVEGILPILLFIILIINICVALVYQCKKRYIHKDSLDAFILSTVIVYFYFRFKYLYYPKPNLFSILHFEIGFVDIFAILGLSSTILSLIFRFDKSKYDACVEINPEDKLHLDRPITDIQNDILDYKSAALNIANRIRSIREEISICIGISGAWGSGKSSFINFILQSLPTKYYKIVTFNPRSAKSVATIQEEFFCTLKDAIAEVDGNFSSVISKYIETISLVDGGVLKKLLSVFDNFSDEEQLRKSISKIIRRKWRRVVIVMEDFDRLTYEELIEVFKLIDNNASIDGLIFICAFDRNHVNNLLKENGISQNDYIEKYFDVEYVLPARPYIKIYKYLEDQLAKFMVDDELPLTEFQNALSTCFDDLSKYAATIRDAKKLINQLSFSYETVRGEVEIEDFMRIALLKLKGAETYSSLSRCNIAVQYGNAIDEAAQSAIISKYVRPDDVEIVTRLLRKTSSVRSFNNPNSNAVYFRDFVYDKLPMKYLKRLLDCNIDYKGDLSGYLDMNQGEHILAYLKECGISSMQDLNQVKRFIELLVYPTILNPLHPLSRNNYFYLLNLLDYHNVIDDLERLNLSKESYAQIYLDILSGSINGVVPIALCRSIMRSIFEKTISPEFITHSQLLEINKANLIALCTETPLNSYACKQMLEACIAQIKEKRTVIDYFPNDANYSLTDYVLDQSCCKLTLDVIRKSPIDYFKNFVIVYDSSGIACDVYKDSIFESNDQVEELINNFPDDFILLKRFWILYKANEYQPFASERPYRALGDNLYSEYNQYNKFQELREKFKGIYTSFEVGNISAADFLIKTKEIMIELDRSIRFRLVEFTQFKQYLLKIESELSECLPA